MPEPETTKNESKTKMCPFTKDNCIEQGCGLWSEVVGINNKKGMCSLPGIIVAVLSRLQAVPMRMPPGGLGPNIFKG